jgi:hypothetical protein
VAAKTFISSNFVVKFNGKYAQTKWQFALNVQPNTKTLTKGFQATLALKKKRQQNSEGTVYGLKKIHSLDIYNEWIR